jgi:hypothetical protein
MVCFPKVDGIVWHTVIYDGCLQDLCAISGRATTACVCAFVLCPGHICYIGWIYKCCAWRGRCMSAAMTHKYNDICFQDGTGLIWGLIFDSSSKGYRFITHAEIGMDNYVLYPRYVRASAYAHRRIHVQEQAFGLLHHLFHIHDSSKWMIVILQQLEAHLYRECLAQDITLISVGHRYAMQWMRIRPRLLLSCLYCIVLLAIDPGLHVDLCVCVCVRFSSASCMCLHILLLCIKLWHIFHLDFVPNCLSWSFKFGCHRPWKPKELFFPGHLPCHKQNPSMKLTCLYSQLSTNICTHMLGRSTLRRFHRNLLEIYVSLTKTALEHGL